MPWTLGIVVDSGQERIQMFTGDRVEPIADQCLILAIDGGPGVLRRTEEYRKVRKLE